MKKILLSLSLIFMFVAGIFLSPSLDADTINLFNPSKITVVTNGGYYDSITYSDNTLSDGFYTFEIKNLPFQLGDPELNNYYIETYYDGNMPIQWYIDEGLADITGSSGNYTLSISTIIESGYIKFGIFDPQSAGPLFPALALTSTNFAIYENGDQIPPTFTYSTATINTPYNNLVTVATIKSQLQVTDDQDGDITSSIVVSSDGYTSVTPKVVGTSYPVVFAASDSAGNTAYLTVYVKVIDNVKPTLTYNSVTYTNGQTITLPSWYNDSPASAKLTLEEIKALFTYADGYYASANLTVNATATLANYYDVPGSYSITLTVTDPSSNTSTYTVNVNVLTNQTPVITGPATQTVEATSFNFSSIMAQYSASDTEDGVLTVIKDASSTWNQTLNPQTLGTFTLVLKATDQFGKVGTKTVSVTVRDTTIPVFKISGTSYTSYAVSIYQSNTSALTTLINSIVIEDAYYGNITSSKVVGTYPSFATPGAKSMTVTVTDASNNSATLTFNITVIDDIAPIINGAVKIVKGITGTLTLEQIKAQLTANDNVDGPLALVLVSDAFTGHSTQVGSYEVVYKATDTAGNVTNRTITVWVVDNVAPVWIVNGYFIPLSINQTVTREELIDFLEAAGMINHGLSYTISFVTDEYTGSESDVGLHNITMLITYSDGSQDTVTVSLEVPDSTIVIDDPSTISISTIIKYGLSSVAIMIALLVGVHLINKAKKHRRNKI
jgi:hypothetical protein